MVSKEIRAVIKEARRKFRSNWLGTYIIKTIFFSRPLKFMNMDGEEYTEYTNLDQLKKYYAQSTYL